MQSPAAHPHRVLPGPSSLNASSNGSSAASLRRGCRRLIDITVRKAFTLYRSHFPLRSFSSLLLITSPWTPQSTGTQPGLPQHLSARGSSFGMAHLKCSSAQPGCNSVTGPGRWHTFLLPSASLEASYWLSPASEHTPLSLSASSTCLGFPVGCVFLQHLGHS